MNVATQIENYIAGQSEPKRDDLSVLHQYILQLMPNCKIWFHDGKNEEGKIVANPTIGYGEQTIKHANGKTLEWFRIGISANTTGISVYILGIEDKKYLLATYGKELGKASITGYCIKFKKLKDINMDVLGEAIRYGAAQET